MQSISIYFRLPQFAYLQVKVYRNALKVPNELTSHMSEETFHKARKYGLDQENFGIFKALLMDVLLLCLELYLGLIALIWKASVDVVNRLQWDASNEILVSCVFVLISNLLSTFKSLPFKIYKIFVLEELTTANRQ